MTANNMKPQGRRRRRTGTPSLRGLQGRSATGQNGQAAKEELSAIWGAGCRKNNSGVPAGRSVFHLTSPFIGLSFGRLRHSSIRPPPVSSPIGPHLIVAHSLVRVTFYVFVAGVLARLWTEYAGEGVRSQVSAQRTGANLGHLAP